MKGKSCSTKRRKKWCRGLGTSIKGRERQSNSFFGKFNVNIKKKREIYYILIGDEKQYEELKQKAIKMLNESKDKATAIADVVDMFASEKHKDLIEEIQAQAIKANSDSNYASKLGLRVLSKEEENFYEKFKDIKQAITGAQIDLIPTSIVDLTMENVKTTEPILKLITFAPAGVKRWITAERTGAYSWSGLTEELKGELSANIKGLVTDLGKLDAYLIIPKAIRDLSYQFIDKYFMAILAEALKEGIAYGYLQGTACSAGTAFRYYRRG